jgi:hypothetical protein
VTGKQVRPTKVFTTKKAAQDWVIEHRSQWSTAAWTPKSTRTFDEVADHWLPLRAADPSIGPETVRADRESLAYARRAFEAVPVQKLTPAAPFCSNRWCRRTGGPLTVSSPRHPTTECACLKGW